MRRPLKIFLFIFSVSVISCTAGKNINSGDYVIRYINLNSIYDYLYNNSSEARDVKRKTDSLNEKIEELENSETAGPKTELIRCKSEIVKMKEQEKKLKSEFYSRIKTAVNNVAAKNSTDFILNSGEGVLYSRPAYDLTNEVLKELKSINERTSPVYK